MSDIRRVTRADAEIIAHLHAVSWQHTYRGILSDQYLDQEVLADRMVYWPGRLASAGEQSFGLLAHVDGEAAGFAFVERDDGAHGHLLDNLHVLPQYKGRKLGRALMAAVAREIVSRQWTPRLHLWVYEDNVSAREFYDHMQGAPVERQVITTRDNREAAQWRYVWDDVRRLIDAKAKSG